MQPNINVNRAVAERSADRLPPADFVRRMKAKDRFLDVFFNNRVGRWIVIRMCEGEVKKNGLWIPAMVPRLIFVWTMPDGGYRELGDDLLRVLDAGDLQNRVPDMDAHVNQMEAREQAAEQKKEIDGKQDIADFVRDHRVTLNRSGSTLKG